MTERAIRVHAVHPVHPGRGEPSHIEMTLILDYIKGTPVVSVRLPFRKALELLEQLATAVRITQP